MFLYQISFHPDGAPVSGRLYVVATPIGNLADASTRMSETLAAVDCVLVEDTRHSGRLLQQIGVKKPLIALHEHNESDWVDRLVQRLAAGETMALISDAGTPAVSDPGFKLIRGARRAAIDVSPVPGPSAVIAALSAAGLPTDKFVFEGFLPARLQARQTALTALADEPRTMVFFESVHRIEEALQDCCAVFGDERHAAIARELTKRHEQIVSAPLGALLQAIATGAIPLKGEFVLVIGGLDQVAEIALSEGERMVEALLAEGIRVKEASRVAARLTGGKRNALYQFALTIQGAGD